MYNKTPIFIPVEIAEDTVESVVQKLSGDSCLGGADSEAIHGWILKLWEDRKRLRTSVEFFNWTANGSPL